MNPVKYRNGRIVQFAKAPVVGRVKTRMIPALGERGARRLHIALTRSVWSGLLSSELAPLEFCCDDLSCLDQPDPLVAPVYHCRQQQGRDLGERMANAIAANLRNNDIDWVILVGSDCPAVDADYLEHAIVGLNAGKELVLGPADDGGYVLIGMTSLQPAIFEDVEWGGSKVLEQTLSHARALALDTVLLPSLPDIDRPEDLLLLDRYGLNG